jgi:UDP-2,3-diacylglucosamine hydrolase
MKISSISDVHVVNGRDNRAKVLKSFLTHPKVLESDYVIFLGDVFDCLVGEQPEQLNEYKEIFSLVEKVLMNERCSFIFIEGNHDFHIKNILSNRFFKYKNFYYRESGISLDVDNRKIFYCHGDEIEIGNPSYQFFRKIIRQDLVRYFFTSLYSLKKLSFLKKRIGEKSIKYFGEYSKKEESFLREKFRGSAQFISEEFGFDAVVCGHSHIEDHLSGENFDYINNGFSRVTNKFVFFNRGEFKLESL